MMSGARPVPPGTGSFRGNVSMLGTTHSATRAPPGQVRRGRRLMGTYGNGPERCGCTALGQGALRTARRTLGLLERLGEGQQRLVRLIEVDGRAQGLPDAVGCRVVQLDAVVLGIVEVDAAGDAMGDGAVDLQAGVPEPLVERAHVVQALHLEGDLLDLVRLLGG